MHRFALLQVHVELEDYGFSATSIHHDSDPALKQQPPPGTSNRCAFAAAIMANSDWRVCAAGNSSVGNNASLFQRWTPRRLLPK
mmetsp:Transcript_7629/g.10399  ORF Transcript_7629/g.10399 Transcript_7629/m.10399 type:complete len:84 (-) Transcript_7629:263-514(-)